jgi:hypothetical protein
MRHSYDGPELPEQAIHIDIFPILRDFAVSEAVDVSGDTSHSA